EELLGKERAWSEAEPWRVERVELPSGVVTILGLNSAWSAGSDDDAAHILLGEYQVRSALEHAEQHGPSLRIALLHHPLEWLRDFDGQKVERLLRGPGGVHFMLRGHLHDGRIKRLSDPDATTIELAAGSCWSGSKWPHGVTVCQLDLDDGRGV